MTAGDSRSGRLAASQSPGTGRWGLPVTSQPHALQLARRLPPLFQASRGVGPTSAASLPCPRDALQSPRRVLLPQPAVGRHCCSAGSAGPVPRADLAVRAAGASLAPVTPASLLGVPSVSRQPPLNVAVPSISFSSPWASRAVVSVAMSSSLPSPSPSLSLPAGSVFVLLLLLVTPASSSHLWPPPLRRSSHVLAVTSVNSDHSPPQSPPPRASGAWHGHHARVWPSRRTAA